MLQYKTHAKEKSLYNTPNTFGVYLMGEVFKWIKARGGLDGDGATGTPRRPGCSTTSSTAATSCAARRDAGSRSLMNVCFRAPTEELEDKFCKEATAPASTGSRATARRAACARASTTRVRSRRSRRWSAFMKEFERANRGGAGGRRERSGEREPEASADVERPHQLLVGRGSAADR